MVDDARAPVESEPRGVPSEVRLTGKRLAGVAVILLFTFTVLSILYFLISIQPAGPAVGLGTIVVLLAGLAVVTLLLYLGTLVLRALDLSAPTEALGMPSGSIRALIAVSLILLFAIVGFVVFRSASDGRTGTSHGISQAQIDKLRLDGSTIVSQSLITPAPGQPAPSAGAELYDVESVAGLSPDAHDFGLQLLSTTITLVVAVAGFYFGAQSVNQAGRETREQLGMIQSARTAARADIIGAVPDPPTGPPLEDKGDEPAISDVDTVAAPGDDSNATPEPDGPPIGETTAPAEVDARAASDPTAAGPLNGPAAAAPEGDEPPPASSNPS
jgi:hypothetical protein